RVEQDSVESSVDKFVTPKETAAIVKALKARPGDLCLVVSGPWQKAYTILGGLRLEVAQRLKLVPAGLHDLLWVTDFPLLEYSEEEKRFVAVHHPFTSPNPQDITLLTSAPEKARARAYDLVLNGTEIAGGSIRIHDSGLQSQLFALMGIGAEEAAQKFGFLLEAFKFGAPPHGGIAFGLDRMIMLMTGQRSIRDVIAFPKTASAVSLMDEAPSTVDKRQLDELHIKII
ncbi:MAG TPA: amino acid--tRNA ligase-related protein, partial [Bacteroidota bacterium]